MTLANLKQAVRASRQQIEIEEVKFGYERSINLYLDSECMEFAATECLSISGVYYNEKGDRAECIARLIKDIKCGFQPISEETKYSNGID